MTETTTPERKVINLAERKAQRTQGAAPAPKDDIPDFITPQDILKMPDAQIEQLLSLIRVRRMTAQLVHERTTREKEDREQSRALAALDKKSDQVFKLLEASFKALDKLEYAIHEMRALRLAVGLEF